MYLAGHIDIDNQQYYIVWKNIKASEIYWCFSPYHKNDIFDVQMGQPPKEPQIITPMACKAFYNENYVLEILKRVKVSGTVQIYGQQQIIETFLETLKFAENYRFADNEITKVVQTTPGFEVITNVQAKSPDIIFNYLKVDSISGFSYYKDLYVVYGGITIKLESCTFSLSEKVFKLEDADKFYTKRVLTKTIKNIDYGMLCDSLDMSWYKKDDVLQKDYKSIKNVVEFETQIMAPMVKEIVRCIKNGEQFNVAVDTETTGLCVYNLSPDNPDKDHCVAIPISWKVNTGFVIFTDMALFPNLDNTYAVSRLAEIFEDFKEERVIEIWEPNSEDTNQLQHMNLFGDVEQSSTLEKGYHKVQYTIIRKFINLIGHNVMFDKRVFIDSDKYFYFNNDTMQMSFNLASKTIKGSNKLKMLTRKLFGHETPELTDILGKGNEDKYRFLADEEVARIYGCADADYTLAVFGVLIKLMSAEMYQNYQALDVPILNILPRSEYYGLLVDEEKAFALGDNVEADIEILKHFAYEYVGLFVNAYEQRMYIDARKTAGYYSTEEEYQQALAGINNDNAKLFEFEFTPTELRHVLFDILKYPIKAWTEGAKPLPKLDKYAMKKLLSEKRSFTAHFNRLEHDILHSGSDAAEYKRLREHEDPKSQKKADKMVLISASEFNKYKYPMALILQKYAELNKEFTAYYKPMRETNMESKIFKSYSLARIETRRIQNAAQTMKGNLKALVQAYSPDYYLLDFDMSQVEYRIMLSLAGHMVMIERMKNPERDYHTETASLVNNIPAHKVDKKTRKNAKSISFGVPYGLGERTLCERLFGNTSQDNLFATRLLLAKWEKANKPIMEFLNSERDNALLARNMSDELRNFLDAWEKDENGNYLVTTSGKKIPKPTGFIFDKYGFYRTFDVSNIDQSDEAKKRRSTGRYNNEEAKIRRPAGNFPIQCFAAELFRIILIRFYNRCEAEGINDKIIWHMLIHDELLCSVHKSIHPFFIYKIVKESCMITMKNHTKYFVGINIGNTWGEVKDDAREAPVYFVDRIIKRWDSGEFGKGPFWFDDPWNDLIKEERAKYVDERINEVIHQVQPNIDTEPINIPHILTYFDNYTVRAYVNDYPYNSLSEDDLSKAELSNPDVQDKLWVSRFESWALGHFPIGKPMINADGKLVVLRKGIQKKEAVATDNSLDLDLSAFFEDDDTYNEDRSYWSFDSDECNSAYEMSSVDDSYEDDAFMYEIDESVKDASNIAEMLLDTRQYENISVMYEQVLVKLDKQYVSELKEYLSKYVSKTGKTVVIKAGVTAERWLKVSEQIDWAALDDFIKGLEVHSKTVEQNNKYKPIFFKVIGENLVITLKNKNKYNNCINWLQQYQWEKGYSIVLKTPIGDTKKLPFKVMINYKNLDEYIKKEM